MAKLCGATIWCDWSMGGPLKDRLFEYVGTLTIKNEVAYQFNPHKRKGYPMILTYDRVSNMVHYFKPFLIDPIEFNLAGAPSV